MRIIDAIVYAIIIFCASFIGAGIGGTAMLIWNGIATLAGWYVGSVLQGAAMIACLALVIAVWFCLLVMNEPKEGE